MKGKSAILALAFVFMACASTQPIQQPKLKKPVPEFDSVRVGMAMKYCGSEIFDKSGKLTPSAKVFYEKGEPTGFWSLTGFNMRTEEDFNYFLYSWNGKCQMMSGLDHPLKVYSRPPLFEGIGGAFPSGFSQLNQSANLFISLADSVGRYEVVLVSDVGLNKINRQTFKSNEIRVKAEIYEITDESRHQIMEVDHRIDLEVWTWIASRASNRDEFSIPDNVILSLKPGTYQFKLRVIGSDNCQGEIEFTRTIPGRLSIGADISNLLFVDTMPPTGDLNFLIKDRFWPTSNFYSGESVTAIAEAKAKVEGEYLVELSLEKYVGNADPDTLREVIFSQVCQIGDTATLLEIHPSFAGITPGAYWMYATITQPNTNIRAESMALIRVKEAKVSTALMYEPKNKNVIAERVIEPPKTTSPVDDFTDSELRAFFKIEDPGFAELIDTLTDSRLFRANILEYLKRKDIATRPDTPDKNEWWEEKVRRYKWCVENLKTKIDDPICDERWRYVILLGIDFDGNPSLASRSGDAGISVYTLQWKDGTELEFRTVPGGAVPTKVKVVKPGSEFVIADALGQNSESNRPQSIDYTAILESTTRLGKIQSEGPKFDPYQGVERVIESHPAITCLFSTEGGDFEDELFFETWITDWTNVSSFSDSGLARDSLIHRFIVRDTLGEVGRREITQTGLAQFLPLTKEERDTLFFPSYSVGGLGQGEYSATFALYANDGKELSVLAIDNLEVPPRTASLVHHKSGWWGTSDIIFATKSVAEGSPGIYIDGNYYHNNPIGIFPEKGQLTTVFEVKTPPNQEFLVLVFLVQIDKDEEILKQISHKTDLGREYPTFSRILHSDDRGLVVFNQSFDLSELKPGRAAVIIRVLDPELDLNSEYQPQAISYRRFVVVKPK